MPAWREKHLKKPGFFSFHDLIERWGISNCAIQRMVRKAILTEHKFGRNRYYKVEDVELIERTNLRPKALSLAAWKKRHRFDYQRTCAEAFRMFRDGATRSAVVCALNISAEEVDRLYRLYREDNLEETYARGRR